MAAVWALVRARLRARRRALVGLALLVGVASGAVMAAAIGARRTDTVVRRQVSAAVAWQATTVALVAPAVGLPLGVGLALLAGVAATVVVANLVAAWPGRVAARTRPAVALRSE
jgi:Zn-dependent protease